MSFHFLCDQEGTGQGRKDSREMSRWCRALGSSLSLFGASSVGGQQREAQEKSRKLSVRRSLLSHDDKIPEQQASLGEGVTKTPLL